MSLPENRESATCVEAISAGGAVIPAFIILSGIQYMGNWYRTEILEEEISICLSATGYINDEISSYGLQHFEKHSKKSQKGIKRLLILDGHGFPSYERIHPVLQ